MQHQLYTHLVGSYVVLVHLVLQDIMLAAITFASASLLVPTPPIVPATAFASSAAQTVAQNQQQTSQGLIFPSELLAVGYQGEQKEYSEDEKNAAKTAGLAVFAFGALPSFWAQYELVWKKEALEKAGVDTSKKKKRR